MKRNTIILMAGALLSVFSIAAAAQAYDQDPAAAPAMETTSTIMGTVSSVSPTSIVVKLSGGDQMIFIRDTTSRVPTMLSAGDAVRVEYETPEPGTFHATNVVLDTAATGSGAATSTPATTPASDQAVGTSPEAMPKTASPLAAIGLLGILALGGGLAFRALRG